MKVIRVFVEDLKYKYKRSTGIKRVAYQIGFVVAVFLFLWDVSGFIDMYINHHLMFIFFALYVAGLIFFYWLRKHMTEREYDEMGRNWEHDCEVNDRREEEYQVFYADEEKSEF